MNFERNKDELKTLRIGKAGIPIIVTQAVLKVIKGSGGYFPLSYDNFRDLLKGDLESLKKNFQVGNDHFNVEIEKSELQFITPDFKYISIHDIKGQYIQFEDNLYWIS